MCNALQDTYFLSVVADACLQAGTVSESGVAVSPDLVVTHESSLRIVRNPKTSWRFNRRLAKNAATPQAENA